MNTGSTSQNNKLTETIATLQTNSNLMDCNTGHYINLPNTTAIFWTEQPHDHHSELVDTVETSQTLLQPNKHYNNLMDITINLWTLQQICRLHNTVHQQNYTELTDMH